MKAEKMKYTCIYTAFALLLLLALWSEAADLTTWHPLPATAKPISVSRESATLQHGGGFAMKLGSASYGKGKLIQEMGTDGVKPNYLSAAVR